MYPDTTGGAFGRGAPTPPIPPAVDAAWIPAQRSPWEPPPRQQSAPQPAARVPLRPEGASADGSAATGPALTAVPEDAVDAAGSVDGVTESVDGLNGGDGVETREPDRPGTGQAAETAELAAVETAESGDGDGEDTGLSDRGTAPLPEARDDRAADPEPAVTPEQAVDPEQSTPPEQAATPERSAETARPLRPGDLPQTRITLWGSASAEADTFRERIREAGNLFVDDPNFAVTATAAVVTEAVTALAAALARQHAELDPRHSSDNPDTEALRVAVLRYRELLDRVLAL